MSVTFMIYATADGSSPYEEWYKTLPAKDAAKMDATIHKIEQFGMQIAAQQQWVKHLEGDIWEIRSQVAGNIQRACYFHIVRGEYLITHGFTKKTQKTPSRQIELAKRIRRQFVLEQEGKR
jgi:phage-related protein